MDAPGGEVRQRRNVVAQTGRDPCRMNIEVD